MRKENKGKKLTQKGAATRAGILDAAHEVFRDTGYYASSISEIMRRAKVSLATFYQYFKNKEQVFQELNDVIIERFMNKADALSLEGLNFDERLRKIIALLYDHTKNNLAFHRILGESELIDRVTLAYYEAIARFLRNFLRKEVMAGNIRSLDPNIVPYGLIGICYYNSINWGEQREELSEQQIVDLVAELVMNGISGPAEWKRPANWDILMLPEPSPLQKETEEPLTKGEKTRQAILSAAEKVFGQFGINRASIAEITREAGVAQGTFYVHFESKSDLFEGLVKYVNHMIRRELQRAVIKAKDRRDAERIGILACYEFVYRHRSIYRLVPEFEMIDQAVALWYYKVTSIGYVQGLELGMQKGEIKDFPALFLARSLMGYTHFIGLKWIVWSSDHQARISDQHLKDIIEFLLYGFKPGKKEKLKLKNT